ncbi:MAG: LysM peptidoglycan-binding domain-containing protein, partial [Spirochaetales bacterium]|nr:LysM peptidoglycan-binding domain-containing protein [Spirochaetales bacterium]
DDDSLSAEDLSVPSFDGGADFEDDFSEIEEPVTFNEELTANSGYEDDEPDEWCKEKRNPAALVVLILLVAAIVGMGVFLFMKGMESEGIPPLEADIEKTTPIELVESSDSDSPVVVHINNEDSIITPDVSSAESTQVKASSTVDDPSDLETGRLSYGDGGGVWYSLKKGDTLWDLSNSFYRTPWLFGLIAVENGIKNPNEIYAGTSILIPEN